MGEGGNNNDGERWKDLTEDRIEKLERAVDSLLAWRSWILGIVAGVGIMAGALAKQIAVFIRGLGA